MVLYPLPRSKGARALSRGLQALRSPARNVQSWWDLLTLSPYKLSQIARLMSYGHSNAIQAISASKCTESRRGGDKVAAQNGLGFTLTTPRLTMLTAKFLGCLLALRMNNCGRPARIGHY